MTTRTIYPKMQKPRLKPFHFKTGIQFILLIAVVTFTTSCKKQNQAIEVPRPQNEWSSLLRSQYNLPIQDGYLSLLEYLNDASLAEMQEIYESTLSEAKLNEDALPALCMSAILYRWSELSPTEFTRYLLENDEWQQSTLPDVHLPLKLLHSCNDTNLLKHIQQQDKTIQLQLAYKMLNLLEEADPFHSEYTLLLDAANQDNQPVARDDTISKINGLIQSDPLSAIEALSANINDPSIIKAFRHRLGPLAEAHPTLVGELVVDIAIQHHDLVNNQLADAIEPWAKVAPLDALKSIEQINSLKSKRTFLQSAYPAWAEVAPEEASKHAYENIREAGIRYNTMPDVLSKWMAQSPEDASKYIETLPSTSFRMFSTIYEPWVRENPTAAISHLVKIADTDLRMTNSSTTSFNSLMKIWMTQDSTGALNWIATQPKGRMTDHLILSAVKALDTPSSKLQLDLINQIQSEHFKNEIALSMLGNLPENAYDQVDQLLSQFPDSVDKSALHAQIMQDWGYSNPALAAENFPAQANRKDKEALLKSLSSAYYRTDSEAAMNWLSTLDPRLQSVAYTDIANSIKNQQGPYAVAQFLDALDEGTPALIYSYRNNAYHWAKSDPDAALEWASNLPPKKDRYTAINYVVSQTLEAYPEKAQSWLEGESLSDTDKLNVTVEISKYYSTRDPLTATIWAMELDDGKRRDQAIQRIKKKKSASEIEALKQQITTLDSLTGSQKSWLQNNL